MTEAQELLDTTRTGITARWGSAPNTGQSIATWTEHVAATHAEAAPETREAGRQVTAAKAAGADANARNEQQRKQLIVQVYGPERARHYFGTSRIPNPAADARRLRQQAHDARRVIAELDARPIAEAAKWLTAYRSAQEAAREAITEQSRTTPDTARELRRYGPSL